MATVGSIINPTKKFAFYLGSHASNNLTKSILAVATPQYADQLPQLAKEFPDVQIITAAVDSVGYGLQRSGFGWCVMEQPVKVLDKVKLQESKNKRNWDMAVSALRLTAGKTDIILPTANTLFTTGQKSALFFGEEGPFDGLHLALPFSLQVQGGYRPLLPITEQLTITSCAANMLKSVDKKAAASHLEESSELMTLPANERVVFAEINGKDYYKVTAGGGGLWSPRTRMLVLDPAAKPKVGDKVRFCLSTGRELTAETLKYLEAQYSEYEDSDAFVFECVPPQESLEEKPLKEVGRQGFQAVFGVGSEQGFFINDLRHEVMGETVWLK